MCARYLLLICNVLFSHSVTVNEYSDDRILSKSKVELTPLFISCRLNDIVTIAAPMINNKDALYYLSRPNGDTTKIQIKQSNYIKRKRNDVYDNEIVVKHIKDDPNAIITPVNNYQIINVKNKIEDNTKLEDGINANDITIGPLSEDDHGNWVMSVYYKDLDGEWIELFQLVTIEIVENVPPSTRNTEMKPGDEFKLSFAYPIRGIKTCELVAPGSTFDRFYTRSNIVLNRCGYAIGNVTKADQGLWTIIGVGRIVYQTQIYLKVLNTIT